MLKKLENYYKPKNLEETLKLLNQSQGLTKIIAGGTAVMAAENNEIKTLIDIKNAGLDKIVKNDDGGLQIGAACTIANLLESNEIKKYCGGLIYEAAYYIASTPLRNMITIGGNITQIFPWSDLPAALIISDAEIHIASEGRNRKLKYVDAVKKHPITILNKNEIVTSVSFPALPGYTGKFIKFSKTNFDYALIDAGVNLKISGGIFEDVRFAVSAAGTLPQNLSESAASLKNHKTSDEQAITESLEKAVSETIFTGDKRASIEYKKEILPVLLKRLIDNAVNENKGGR